MEVDQTQLDALREENTRLRQRLAELGQPANGKDAAPEPRPIPGMPPDLVLHLDRDGRFLEARVPPVATTALLSRPPSELVGQTIHDVLPPPLARQLKRRIDRALETGESCGFSDQWSQPRGARHFVSQMMVSEPDEVVLVVWEVTARHAARPDAEDIYFQSLYEAMSEGVAVHRLIYKDGVPVNYRIIDTNPTFTEQTGLDRHSAVGRLATDVYGVPEPPYLDVYAEVSSSGHPARFEAYFEPLHRHFSISAFALAPGYFATVFSDVTDRQEAAQALRESEERYRALFEQAQDAFLLEDADGGIVQANPAATAILGYTRDELAQMRAIDLLPQAAAEGWTHLSRLANGRECFECVGQRRDGTQVPLEVIATDLTLHQATLALVVLRDVSQRKQLETQRLELAIEREKTRILSDFVVDISHEFRTPLSVINTNLYLLQRVLADGDGAYAIRDVAQETEYITQLVEGLITMARLDSAAALDLHPLDLNALLHDLSDAISGAASERDQVLALTLRADVPPVMGDGSQLCLAVMNLVQNAVRYTAPGGAIDVSTRHDDGWSLIEVCDDGQGIAEDDLPHIFNRFYRADKVRTTHGPGLGLPIVRKIVELHGGKVEVDTGVGEGSTFRIRLPSLPG